MAQLAPSISQCGRFAVYADINADREDVPGPIYIEMVRFRLRVQLFALRYESYKILTDENTLIRSLRAMFDKAVDHIREISAAAEGWELDSPEGIAAHKHLEVGRDFANRIANEICLIEETVHFVPADEEDE